MRISDWSSDVCSSDLAVDIALGEGPRGAAIAGRAKGFGIAISRDYTTALAEAALVISVVTGTEAMNAAMAAKPHLRPGSIYCDFNRSEERRVGEECVSTCRSRWSPYP